MVNTTPAPGSKTPPADAADLLTRYADQLLGHLRCFDRIILQGTLVDVAHPGALAVQIHAAGFKPRDLVRFAQPFNDQVRDNAITLARQHGLQIEFIAKKNFRQEDRIAQILQRRGTHPGLVHVFSAKEPATVFEARGAQPSGYAKLVARRGQCLHYYFYWMHQTLGLIYVRVATWLPLRVQIYLNGHSWLARQLDQAGLSYQMADNALVGCADWAKAQALADALDPRALHTQLDQLARQCCPAAAYFKSGYHWSLAQVEYAHDLIFKDPAVVERLFDELARHSLLAVRADDVARFLGRSVPWSADTRVDSHLGRRYEGLRLKHAYGPASVKMYNKPGGILRLEVTTYDVSFFKHYRTVEHRDGTKEACVAPMRKNLYSLRELAAVMRAAVERYRQWLSGLVDRSATRAQLERVGRAERDEQGRSHRGFNLMMEAEQAALETVLRGEETLGGLTARRVRKCLGWKPSQISRWFKRLRLHGLVKKIGRSYTYHVTAMGRRVLNGLLHLKDHLLSVMGKAAAAT